MHLCGNARYGENRSGGNEDCRPIAAYGRKIGSRVGGGIRSATPSTEKAIAALMTELKMCDQRKALLESAGDLLVLGGPGSGKTTIALVKAATEIERDALAPGQKVSFSASRGRRLPEYCRNPNSACRVKHARISRSTPITASRGLSFRRMAIC